MPSHVMVVPDTAEPQVAPQVIAFAVVVLIVIGCVWVAGMGVIVAVASAVGFTAKPLAQVVPDEPTVRTSRSAVIRHGAVVSELVIVSAPLVSSAVPATPA